MIKKPSLHVPAEMWRLSDLATYKTNQDYVWNPDVILNHMTFTFVFLNKAFFATSLNYRLLSSSPKMFRLDSVIWREKEAIFDLMCDVN